MDAQYWINLLGLEKHPEGGFYREVYRSDESVYKSALPERFEGKRSLGTAIYYLLDHEDVSCFHRVKQDEIWHFYEGSPVIIYCMEKQRLSVFRLGCNPAKGQLPMLVIPGGTLFAAEVEKQRSYALMGCTVSPGFDFSDMEIPSRSELSHSYPEHLELIKRFTQS